MATESSDVVRRARVHAALGDPARLAIVDTLVLGDASPGEIASALDMPTNLVAHHLKVLEETGLVERARSEGDRRRTYVRLIPATLAAIAGPRVPPARRVVFVCTHNSARSQMAAALWATRSEVPVASAGTMPARRVHPRALKTAARHGLTIDATRTADIAGVLRADDLVIAVCDNAHEQLGARVRTRLHWSVPDPAPVDNDAAFETAFSDIADRIERLAPILEPPGGDRD